MPPAIQTATRPRRHWHLQFRGRFALLFCFLLASITFYPYAETSGLGYYAFRIVGAAIILLVVWAVTFRLAAHCRVHLCWTKKKAEPAGSAPCFAAFRYF